MLGQPLLHGQPDAGWQALPFGHEAQGPAADATPTVSGRTALDPPRQGPATVVINTYWMRTVQMKKGRMERTTGGIGLSWGQKFLKDLLGIYHVGVEVHGEEYTFGNYRAPNFQRLGVERSGVVKHRPRQPGVHCEFKQNVSVGTTTRSVAEVEAICAELGKSQYLAASYNRINHNCVDFARSLCAQLGAGDVPGWCYRGATAAKALGIAAGSRAAEEDDDEDNEEENNVPEENVADREAASIVKLPQSGAPQRPYCKALPAGIAQRVFEVGERVHYFSRTNAQWIPAVVLGHNAHEEGAGGVAWSYCLDVQNVAPPSLVAPIEGADVPAAGSGDVSSALKPATHEMCFANVSNHFASYQPSLPVPRQFDVGQPVWYKSRTIGQFLPGVVQGIHVVTGPSGAAELRYKLDVQSDADASRMAPRIEGQLVASFDASPTETLLPAAAPAQSQAQAHSAGPHIARRQTRPVRQQQPQPQPAAQPAAQSPAVRSMQLPVMLDVPKGVLTHEASAASGFAVACRDGDAPYAADGAATLSSQSPCRSGPPPAPLEIEVVNRLSAENLAKHTLATTYDPRTALTVEELPCSCSAVKQRGCGPELWGITLEQLKDLARHMRFQSGMTTRDVVDNIIKVETAGTGAGYALLRNSARPLRAKVMVSHAWDEDYEDFLLLLETSGYQGPFWVSATAIYQPEDNPDLTLEKQLGVEAGGPLVLILKQADLVLCVMTRKGNIFERLWCLFEMFTAVQLEVQLQVACTKKRGRDKPDDPFPSFCLAPVSARTARCGPLGCPPNADEEAIRGALEAFPGSFAAVDRAVEEIRLGALRLCRQQAMQEAQEASSAPSCAARQLHLQYKEAIEAVRGRLGRDPDRAVHSPSDTGEGLLITPRQDAALTPRSYMRACSVGAEAVPTRVLASPDPKPKGLEAHCFPRADCTATPQRSAQLACLASTGSPRVVGAAAPSYTAPSRQGLGAPPPVVQLAFGAGARRMDAAMAASPQTSLSPPHIRSSPALWNLPSPDKEMRCSSQTRTPSGSVALPMVR
jgi:hypothetical protein